MNKLYAALGYSKQAFHQKYHRFMYSEEMKAQLLPVIYQIREDHPRISTKEIYYMIQPAWIGRDAFIDWLNGRGFKLFSVKNVFKTTHSIKAGKFDNLIKGMELTGVNQVWVSDITYYWLVDMVCYITMIMDLFSRKILGYSLSSTLRTDETTIVALNMAIGNRKGQKINKVILHSDGGGQYYSHKFLDITRKYGIQNSMADNVYDNPHIERLHGTIKNDYLLPKAPADYKKLKKELANTVDLYNRYRPHQKIGRKTPEEFENQLFENIKLAEVENYLFRVF